MANEDIYGPCILAPVVQTEYGKVQGRWQNATSAAYLGIPFAAPPIGALRFAAPAPPDPWDGIRLATDYGPTAQLQGFGGAESVPEPSIPGDATLNVNVFTPAPRDRRAKLPVLVWIHGGGFYAGSPASPWYNGSSFNRDGIVTVTISYRLGFDGFGWIEDAPANRGILDQIAALEWVQRNIAEFGGDPDKVTIAGQSAGGESVQTLMVCPKAKGLFRAAISESGCYGQTSRDDAERVGKKMAEECHIEPTVAGWKTLSPEDVLAAQKPHEHEIEPSLVFTVDQVFDALGKGFFGEGGLTFGPMADGEIIPDRIEHLTAKGAGSDIPLLAGSARDEFYFPIPAPPLEAYMQSLRDRGISEDSVQRFAADVHRIGDDHACGTMMTLWTYHIGLVRLAMNRRSHGAGARTWLYDFAQYHAYFNGSTHCSDIPYFFDLLHAPNAQRVLGAGASQRLADAMHGMWVDFIADGKTDAPSVEDHPFGATRFQNGASFSADAYTLEGEILRAAGFSL